MNNTMRSKLQPCRIVILLIPLFFCTISTMGQVSGEYFWNSDPGIGRASKMTDNGEADGYHSFTLDAQELRPGINMLGMRAFSGGRWTQTLYNFVIVETDPKVSTWSGEYFWDNDPGIGKATPLTTQLGPTGGMIDSDVLTDGLAPGQHIIGFRMCSGSAWSPTVTSIVTISDGRTAEITGAEYFWGADPGFGNGTPIVVEARHDASVELKDIDFPQTVADEYVLSLRARSAQGWGTTVTRVIPHLYVEAIDLTSESTCLPVGETMKIVAAITPADAFDAGLTWTSSDTSVATVEADGTVTGIAPGRMTVTATSVDGSGVTASCTISVTLPLAESIILDHDNLNMKIGETVTVKASVTPATASQVVEWICDNPDIASVDNNGVVTALSPGGTVITALVKDDSGLFAYCEVTVEDEAGIDGTEADIRPIITTLPSEIIIAGIPDDESIRIIAQSGSVVYCGTEHRITDLVPEVYIVIVRSHAYKVYVR